jgi:cell division septal protein FtsQ
VWRHVLWGVVVILVVFLVGYGIWYVTRLPAFTISDITIQGGTTVSHDMLQSIVGEELNGSYLHLVPHRFALTYPKKAIKQKLGSVPRVHNVSVTRDGYTGLHITFDEYIPEALLCASTDDSAPCYFLDKEGYAFAESPPLVGGTFVRYVIEDLDAKPGVQAFKPQVLHDTEQLLSVLASQFGFRVYLITYNKDGDTDYHFTNGGRLFATRSMSTQEIYGNLKSILSSDQFKHLLTEPFNYIDLRFGNKIFVNEHPMTASTTSATSSNASTTERAFDIQ